MNERKARYGKLKLTDTGYQFKPDKKSFHLSELEEINVCEVLPESEPGCFGLTEVGKRIPKAREYPEVGDKFINPGFVLQVTQSDLAKNEGRFRFYGKTSPANDA